MKLEESRTCYNDPPRLLMGMWQSLCPPLVVNVRYVVIAADGPLSFNCFAVPCAKLGSLGWSTIAAVFGESSQEAGASRPVVN